MDDGVASDSAGGGGDGRQHGACGRASPGQVDRRAVVRLTGVGMHDNNYHRSARAFGDSRAQQYCRWATHVD